MKRVCVVGLGYVGLPLACLCNEKGYFVYGVNTDKKKAEMISKSICPIKDADLEAWLKRVKIHATTDASVIKDSDVVLVCVPTPVDENHQPNLSYVENATNTISKYLHRGHIIIIESTLAPCTTEGIIKPILEKSGLKAGKDFDLAYCPERIDPGNKKWSIRNIPRVIGGITKQSTRGAAEFYRSILDAEVIEVKSPKEAEAAKIVENAFRDINIAFVNELAKSFDRMDIDIMEVLKAASTKPFAFMRHEAGTGVGGHCIPVDPYYLIERARYNNFEHAFLELAREINESMPAYTISRLEDGLREAKRKIKNTKITVLGVAYKGGIDDIRESPALKIIELLKKKGVNPTVYDPYVPEKSNVKNLDEALKTDCIIIATDHPEFKKIKPKELKKAGVEVVIDGRNILDKEGIKILGIIYRGIGR